VRPILFVAAILLLALTFVATAADDQPWFDMKKCEFCNKIAAQPGLLEHMTTQYFQLHNGTMSVVHIDHDYQPAFTKAMEAMRPVVQALQAGKPVYTCPHCTTLGEFYMQGIVPDDISSGDDRLEIFTSCDSTIVKKLREFGTKSEMGIAALMKQPK
jgi:hypothetical protein